MSPGKSRQSSVDCCDGGDKLKLDFITKKFNKKRYDQRRKISYPTNPENNVYFEYGSGGNATGRISKSQDAAGVHVYEYGNMGELIHKRSTGYVPVAGGEHYTFSTHWVYDSWNRIKQITYPDGELVRYRYNAGGQLVSMAGEKLSAHQSYIDTLLYDEYGSRTQIAYGNGIVSDYSYAADTRRLSSLQTSDGTNDLQQLSYTYDPVGNITAITNTAGPVSGLGGAFSYTYSYDSLYRLDSAAGSSLDMPYTLAMAYSPSGNILRKTLSASKLILGNNSSESYDREYSYNGAHQLSDIQELVGSDPSTQYSFDGSGNMTLQEFHDPQAGVLQRTLCWDEENRLAGTSDNNYVTANIYDGSGNRAWKLAGELQLMWQNGLGWVGSGDLNLRSWYQSEHMTLTDQGYTKHYFIEGQRIASKLGTGFAALEEGSIQQPVEPIHSDLSELPNEMVTRLGRDFECLGLEYGNFYGGSERLEAMDELYTSGEGGEPDVYFYHSDHLGSSSFITDGSAFPTQHLQYLPFGEDFIQQQNTAAYYSPFTFSGKERDFETSLSYFGARYYDASLSIWLSVDPMSDKYPSLSAYNYCALNPVMLVDPDGREIIVTKSVENGVTNVHIQFTGKIINTSNTEMYKEQLQTFGNMIADQLQSTYSGEFEGMNVTFDACITAVTSFSEVNGGQGQGGDHLFNIADSNHPNLVGEDGQLLPGAANICGTTAFLSEAFLQDTDQILRTSAHEFGHLAGLDHPDGANNTIPNLTNRSPNNLMHQSRITSGLELVKEQIDEIIKGFYNE